MPRFLFLPHAFAPILNAIGARIASNDASDAVADRLWLYNAVLAFQRDWAGLMKELLALQDIDSYQPVTDYNIKELQRLVTAYRGWAGQLLGASPLA